MDQKLLLRQQMREAMEDECRAGTMSIGISKERAASNANLPAGYTVSGAASDGATELRRPWCRRSSLNFQTWSCSVANVENGPRAEVGELAVRLPTGSGFVDATELALLRRTISEPAR